MGKRLLGQKTKKVTIDEKEITENLKLSTIYLFNTKNIGISDLSGEEPTLFSYRGNLYVTGHKVTETETGAYINYSADIPMKFRDTEFGDNVSVNKDSKVFTYDGALYFMPLTSGNKRVYHWTGSSWEYTGYNYGGFPVIYKHKIHLLNADGKDKYGRWEQGVYHYAYNGMYYHLIGKMLYKLGVPVVYNKEIHLLGGDWDEYNKEEDSGGKMSRNHYKYNGDSWTRVENLSFDFDKTNNDISAFCYNNEIHALNDIGYCIGNGTSWRSAKYNNQYLGFNSANPPGAPWNIPVVYNDKLYYYDYIPDDDSVWRHALVIIEPTYIKQ